MQLQAHDKNLSLIVEDDGKGFDSELPDHAGSGLPGLRERAEQLGGQIRIGRRLGGGTQLSFDIPLPEKGDSHD